MTKSITVGELRHRYHSDFASIFRWISASANSSFLESSAAKAATLRDILRQAKIAANRARMEDLANEMLGRECVAAALEHETRMWLGLRQEHPHDAWRHFVDAEQHIHLALRTPIGSEFEAAYAGRFPAMERVLFPHMMFMSAGFNHDEGFCTICEQRMSTCAHVKGRIYFGQVCAERGFGKFEADHVAIVDHPMDKHCYIEKYKTADGKWIDRLSGEETSATSDQETSSTSQGDATENSSTMLVQGTIMTNRLPVGAVL